MIKIAIQGICGRMGGVLVDMITKRSDCRLVAGVDIGSAAGLPCPVVSSAEKLSTLDEAPDVLIDFSHPGAVEATLEYCTKVGLPYVVCTTGLSEEQKEQVKKASEKSAVFYSANMSLGISLLVNLVQKAVSVLQGFDVEIVEKHHGNKLDAPSGTAIMLADAANDAADGRFEYVYDRSPVRQKRGENELGISAVRGGSIVGEHDVLFCGQDEVITLSHTAYSRNVFAAGAVTAALYVAGKGPGLYDMHRMLEELE